MGMAEACLFSSEFAVAPPMMPPRRASPTFVAPCFICLPVKCLVTGPLVALALVGGAAPALAVVAAVLALSISLAVAAAAFYAATFAAKAASLFFCRSMSGSSRKWKSLW